MLESLIVVAALAILAALATLSPAVLLYGGLVGALVTVVVGIIAGIAYHVLLHRHLAPRGQLPRFWWWNPVPFNRHLLAEERRTTMTAFGVGAASFGLSMLGCVCAVTGLVRAIAS